MTEFFELYVLLIRHIPHCSLLVLLPAQGPGDARGHKLVLIPPGLTLPRHCIQLPHSALALPQQAQIMTHSILLIHVQPVPDVVAFGAELDQEGEEAEVDDEGHERAVDDPH